MPTSAMVWHTFQVWQLSNSRAWHLASPSLVFSLVAVYELLEGKPKLGWDEDCIYATE